MFTDIYHLGSPLYDKAKGIAHDFILDAGTTNMPPAIRALELFIYLRHSGYLGNITFSTTLELDSLHNLEKILSGQDIVRSYQNECGTLVNQISKATGVTAFLTLGEMQKFMSTYSKINKKNSALYISMPSSGFVEGI
jgi:hypothetical protein